MKYLVMCEGPNEVEIMNILIDNDLLSISRDDLLDLRVFHARQINSNAAVRTAINLYPNKIIVLRIGDTLKDELKVTKEYKNKIDEIRKYCTKPGVEILLIICENLIKEYEKVKSKTSPKSFCKEHVKNNKCKYDNSTKFYTNYFSQPQNLVNALKTYKRIHTNKKDELYLADLLK